MEHLQQNLSMRRRTPSPKRGKVKGVGKIQETGLYSQVKAREPFSVSTVIS